MNKKLVAGISLIVLLIVPAMALAVTLDDLAPLICRIADAAKAIVLAISVIMFIISAFYFITGDQGKGKTTLIWGVVGLVVLLMAYSLPTIVGTFLGEGVNAC